MPNGNQGNNSGGGGQNNGGGGSQGRKIDNLLSGLGLHGDFTKLIDHAIRENWSDNEFLQALVKMNQFQRQFPGLIAHGGIAAFLNGGNTVVGTTTLGTAIKAYDSLVNAYTQTLRGQGIPLTKDLIGELIKGQVSPDEFGRRVQAVGAANSNPQLKKAFDDQLKLSGEKPLDAQGWLKFLAGEAPTSFYDIYEGAYLQNANIGLTAAEARAVAQGGINTNPATGGQADLAGIVAEVRKVLPDVGPELRAAGISAADLTLLEAGSDPRGLLPKVQQIVAQRRQTGAFVPGMQPHQSQSGGFALQPDETPAAY